MGRRSASSTTRRPLRQRIHLWTFSARSSASYGALVPPKVRDLIAELHAAHTPATYAYLFTWKSPGWDGKLGAGHEVNTPFVFGTLDAPDSQDLVPAGSPVGDLPTQMQDAWIAFARTGSPQTPALAGWQPYTAGRRSTMLLGPSCGPVEAPFEAQRRLWDARVPSGRTPA